tara:strand:- start:484 stop:966 length:483 start_codon:yes stop_codon:yes gene_type:complete
MDYYFYNRKRMRKLFLLNNYEELKSKAIVLTMKYKANLELCDNFDVYFRHSTLYYVSVPNDMPEFNIKTPSIYIINYIKYLLIIIKNLNYELSKLQKLIILISYGKTNTLYAIPHKIKSSIIKMYPELYKNFTLKKEKPMLEFYIKKFKNNKKVSFEIEA